jgi:hypothetical protein
MIVHRRWTAVSIVLAAALVSSGAAAFFAQTSGAGRPPRGWLYVVASDIRTHTGRVLVVDPLNGRVAREFSKGYKPEVLPSLDGTRLFVTYDNSFTPGGAFEVIDAASGEVSLHIDESYARDGIGSYSPRLALSRDGAWVYRYKAHHTAENGYAYWIETFDAIDNAMLPDVVSLPTCGWAATLHPSTQRDRLFVICPDSEDVRVVTLTPRGGSTDRPPRVALGRGAKRGYALPAFVNDGELTVIKTNGALVKIATDTPAVIQQDAVDRVARAVAPPDDAPPQAAMAIEPPNPLDWIAGRVLVGRDAAVSADGSRMFLNAPGRAGRSEFVILNPATFEKVGAIPYARSLDSFTLSEDARSLYAIDHANAQLVVFDTASGIQARIVKNVGPGPAFAVLAP